MAELLLDALSVTRGKRTLLHPCSARIGPGGFTAIVGPNGAGKSTLLRAIAGLIPAKGSAQTDGRAIAAMPPLARARALAYLPQQHDFTWPITARAMVALGRYAFGSQPMPQPSEDAAIDKVMAACGIAALADQPVDRLSGGECALVALTRILVADTPLLLLDEPVAALDIARQYAVLEHLAGLAAQGRTIVAVLHDIALVAQFADHILWLADGTLVATSDAAPAAINEHVERLFGRMISWSGNDAKPVPFFQR